MVFKLDSKEPKAGCSITLKAVSGVKEVEGLKALNTAALLYPFSNVASE